MASISRKYVYQKFEIYGFVNLGLDNRLYKTRVVPVQQ